MSGAFTHAGAQVFVCGRNPPEPGTLPSAVEFITADVRDPEDGARLIDSVTTHAGKLDVPINNAGGGPLADAAKA